jgi:hypothetical protein
MKEPDRKMHSIWEDTPLYRTYQVEMAHHEPE